MSRCLQCGGVYGTCVCEPIPHQFTYVQLLLYTKSEIEAEVAAERARCVALVEKCPDLWWRDQLLRAIESPQDTEQLGKDE